MEILKQLEAVQVSGRLQQRFKFIGDYVVVLLSRFRKTGETHLAEVDRLRLQFKVNTPKQQSISQ
ncbi:MAG: hypothetical protein MJK10_14485 [Pseudomonadales bacterium]|nr:hypothetical protein [Pseudomonadales bacterium]NRA17089.1 hypothetical protein [Oceanospirillaceae bacterium]